jgi:hypothetical protein
MAEAVRKKLIEDALPLAIDWDWRREEPRAAGRARVSA